jgi:hypothetical protein
MGIMATFITAKWEYQEAIVRLFISQYELDQAVRLHMTGCRFPGNVALEGIR